MASINLNIIDAVRKLKESSDTKERIENLYAASSFLEVDGKENARLALWRLGKLRRDAYANIVPKLVELLKKIEANPDDSNKLDEQSMHIPPVNMNQSCQDACNTATTLVAGTATASGVIGGGLTAFGAYSAVAAFGSASTGTAISTLGGQAAVNATLAWLGGGSLAAGGLGTLGGSIMLGGLVAVPAILICGVSLNAQADKLLAQNETELIKAKKFQDEKKLIAQRMTQIEKIANLASKVLKRLSKIGKEHIEFISQLTESKGYIFEDYSDEDKKRISKSFGCFEFLNHFSTIKIMDETGAPILESEKDFITLESECEKKL